MFVCIRCHELFKISDMAKEGDRLPSYCKPCRNKMRNIRYAANPEYYRKYSNDYRKVDRLLNNSAYRTRDNERYERDKLVKPEVIRAQNRVHDDFRSPNRKLVKRPCEMCGADAQAHHEDYSKPLEVRWLCPVHHRQRHEGMGLMELQTMMRGE